MSTGDRGAAVEEWFSELDAMGGNAVRFWAFQSFTDDGQNFQRFDELVRLANQYDVKLAPVLENQWTDCTDGGFKHSDWYDEGYKQPYGDYSVSLLDYIDRIVPRYADEPAILMWQIMNEAENKDQSGSCGDFTLFNEFARDVSHYIRARDPNHLISFGTIGSGQCGAMSSDQYRQLHAHPNIDVATVHDYGQDSNAMPWYVSNRLQIADELNKPFFVGEAGIKDVVSQRPAYLEAKIDTQMAAGVDGHLIWSYRNTDTSGNDGYDFNFSDPLVTDIYPRMTAKYTVSP